MRRNPQTGRGDWVAISVDTADITDFSAASDITEFVDQTPWRLFYSDADGDIVELGFGSDGEYLKSNGAALAPTWSTPAGGAHDAVTVTDGTTIDFTLATQNITAEVIAQGDTGNIQYNNADALTAAAGLNWDNANNALQIRGEIDAKSVGSALTRLQVLPYAEDSVWLGFDVAFNGADWVSSDAGSNYTIAKVGDQLRFYGDGGIAVGSNASLEILGYFDWTGFFQANNVIQTGQAGLDGGLWIYSEQGVTDYTLKLLPNAAMTSDALFYFPADEPAADSLLFVSTAGVMTYKAIGTDVQAYDADLADLADGELTASKVGGVKDADYGEITVSGGTWTVDDSVAVTSWNLITPTITTSLTADAKTISEAEIGRLDGLTSAIIDDDKIDTFAELDTIVADKSLVNKADGAVWLGVHDFGGATSVEVPNVAGDVTCDASGEVAIDTTNKQLAVYDGAAEVAIPLRHIIQGNVGTGDYDRDPDVWIADLHADVFPNGIYITAVYVDCNEADPTTELTGDLKYCDAVGGGAFPGASATVIKALDTTTGNMADAAVNTAVATGKTLYITIDDDPVSDTTVFHVRVHYRIPESA